MPDLNLTWAEQWHLYMVGLEYGLGVGLEHTDEQIKAWIQEHQTYTCTLDEAVALLKKPLLEALHGLREGTPERQIELHERTLAWQKGLLLSYRSLAEHFSRDTESEQNRAVAARQLEEVIPILEQRADRLQQYIDGLYKKLGKRKRRRKTPKPALGQRGEFFSVSSANPMQFIRDTLAAQAFNPPDPDNRWPYRKHKSKGLDMEVQVRPEEGLLKQFPSPEALRLQQEQMWAISQQMDDETTDCLDVIVAKWLAVARHPEEGVTVHVNELVQARGLKKKLAGGYAQKLRRRFAHHVERMASLWVIFNSGTIIHREVTTAGGKKERVREDFRDSSRMLNVTARRESTLRGWDQAGGEVSYTVWRLQPGIAMLPWITGDCRQLALLHTKALEYDPYRLKYEKRLLRYLAWQWRVRRREGALLQPFTVQTLLEAIHLHKDRSYAWKTLERLEKALDKLEEDKLLHWEYDGWDSNKGWDEYGWDGWVNARVIIEPPQQILDLTAKFPAGEQRQLPTKAGPGEGLPRLLKEARLNRNLTQLQAVEQIQDRLRAQGLKKKFSRAYYGMIEAGKKEPSPALKRVLLEWVK